MSLKVEDLLKDVSSRIREKSVDYSLRGSTSLQPMRGGG